MAGTSINRDRGEADGRKGERDIEGETGGGGGGGRSVKKEYI